MRITCLILARGGSKGIPGKNHKDLCGIPLIGWTLGVALDWKKFDSIWVSTDSEEIANISRKYGVKVHHRSNEFSLDTTPSIDSVLEFLIHHEDVKHLALLQCTSPCLQPRFLDEADEMISSGNYDSVFAVRRDFSLRWKELSITDSGLTSTEPLNFDPKHRPRRQDWSGEIIECGMFYFTSVALLKSGYFQGGRCGYVEIPKEYCLEIDTPFDWLIAETILPLYGHRNYSVHSLSVH